MKQDGFSLVEVLAWSGLVAILGLALMECLGAVGGTQRVLEQQSELRGRLEQAAQQFVLDLRFAGAPVPLDPSQDCSGDLSGVGLAFQNAQGRLSYCWRPNDGVLLRTGQNGGPFPVAQDVRITLGAPAAGGQCAAPGAGPTYCICLAGPGAQDPCADVTTVRTSVTVRPQQGS